MAKVPVGRVVYTRQALPAVLPLNFSLDTDSSVVLRTSVSSDLVRAIDGVVVAFEADEFDAASRSGWSVVVTGRATGGDGSRRTRTAVTDRAALVGRHERRGLRTHRVRWSAAGNSPVRNDSSS